MHRCFQNWRMAAALAATLAFAPLGWAQSNCKTFRGLAQSNWIDVFVPSPLAPILQAAWTDPGDSIRLASVYGWQGPFAGTLDGKLVFGYYSSVPSEPTQNGVSGKEGTVTSKLDFGKDGYLITVSDNKGVFPMPPGYNGFGAYSEAAKVAVGQGDGKYHNASGNLSYSGPWIWWPTTDSTLPTAPGSGIWQTEINGRICNVAP